MANQFYSSRQSMLKSVVPERMTVDGFLVVRPGESISGVMSEAMRITRNYDGSATTAEVKSKSKVTVGVAQAT